MIENSTKSAQIHDRPEPPKRFYNAVAVESRAEGHVVLLDGRELRTPARRPLVLSSQALAEAVAAEWASQSDRIEPAAMPITRIINSAIDAVSGSRDSVSADIARFAEADLICYRAAGPESLVAAQQAHWDPLVVWAREAMSVQLRLAEGVMYVAQPPGTCERIVDVLGRFDAIGIAALHVMTTLTGSCILALAVADGRLSADQAWSAAHIDEDWQASHWGDDAEAIARRAARWREMDAAGRIISLSLD